MKKASTLQFFQKFPKPDEKSDHIEHHFQYWRTLNIDGLEPEEIILLGAMGSTTNQKSKAGNYYFEIKPIYIVEIGDDGVEEYLDGHKAYIIFKPSQKEYHLKHLIQHTSDKVMSATNRATTLIDLQKGNKEYPNSIHPLHLNPAMILAFKKDIIDFFANMEDLQLENKRGSRRAMWTNEKGYFYMGICPIDYSYPPTTF